MSPEPRDKTVGMSPAPGSKKPYPKGRAAQLTPAWKSLVQSKLTALGHGHRWLEEQIGVGRGQVSRMLAAEQQTSKLVHAVCTVLDLPPPLIASNDRDEQELVRRFREMDEDSKNHLMGLVKRLAVDKDGTR